MKWLSTVDFCYCVGWLFADTIETYAVHPYIFYHHDICKHKYKKTIKCWLKHYDSIADSVSKWQTNICLFFMSLTHLHKTWDLHMKVILLSSILLIQACKINSGIVTSLNVHFTLHYMVNNSGVSLHCESNGHPMACLVRHRHKEQI